MEEKTKKISAVDRVVEEIINSIISGKLKPGDRLPTEPELSREYNVGRNSVREAIKQLEAFGILYIKRADGTYITDSYDGRMLDPMLYSLILQEHDWKDFVQLRAVIDIGTLHVALRSGNVETIVPGLHRILDAMREEFKKPQPDIDKLLDMDLRFHNKIAGSINNPQITTVNNYITRLSLPSRRQSIEKWIRDGKADTFIELHSEIVDVIEKRDVSRIEQVIEAHYIYWRIAQ
jgi:GntR family transcriptional repressor for pyruvate dehydrogenase complex